MNERFLEQLETMTPPQRETVMDFCGILIEMHLRTLKTIVELILEGEPE